MKYLSFALLLFLFLTVTGTVAAQVDTIQPVATASVNKTVDYALPYPGLLPDSPFYPLKMLRDRIVGYLISDPVRKAEFNILQAEKRVQAGIYLLNNDQTKANLALATIAKGQDYFSQGVTGIDTARKQGAFVSDLVRKATLSSQKQEEVITKIGPNIPAIEKAYYMKIMLTAKALTEKASAEKLNSQDK